MGKITLTNIAEELSVKSGLTKETADNFMRAIVDTIEKGLREDNIVKIKGLGTFKLMEVSDRGSIDVNTGERITIKGYTKVTFTPDSAMKEFVNRPFAHFEPTELNEGYQDKELIADEEQSTTNTEEPKEATSTSLPIPMYTASDEATDNTQETESQSVEEKVEESATEIVDIDTQEIPVQEEAVESGNNDSIEIEITEKIDSTEMETVDNTEDSEEDIEEVTVIVQTAGQEPTMETVKEASADLQSENVATSDVLPVNKDIAEEKEEAATTITSETEEDTKSEKKQTEETEAEEERTEKTKSRRGCRVVGCLFAIFIILAAIVVFYFVEVTTNGEEILGGQSEIMVNPHLDEELDPGYREDSVKETKQTLPVSDSIQAETVTITEPLEKDSVSSVSETAQNLVAGEDNVKTIDSPSVITGMGTLVITESLASKSIKDITPADTLDYAMDGTHTTHTLQSGETIIQLSRKYYGDKRLWPYIVKYNNIMDFNKVAVGTPIQIPVLKNKPTE